MIARIKKIMGTVLNIDIDSYKENDLNREKIEQWDSLAHLIIVSCLEEEFKINIDPKVIGDITDFSSMAHIVSKLARGRG